MKTSIPIWLSQFRGYLHNPNVTDITIDQQGGLWVDYGSGLVQENWSQIPDPEDVTDLAIDLIAEGGRHLDIGHPIVDTALGQTMRVHAVLPPISNGGAVLTVRRQRLTDLTLFALRQTDPDYFPGTSFQQLMGALERRDNILISGSSGSGKTTLLRSIIATLPSTERVIAIEDLPELNLDRGNYVQLSARQPNSEGVGHIPLTALLVETLRMRPDRIVLGEVRGAEFSELLTAFNTGHNGGAFSIHASGLAEIPARLEALGALSNYSEQTVLRQVLNTIHFVVHLRRTTRGRKIVALGEFFDGGGKLSIRQVSDFSMIPASEYVSDAA